MQNEADGLAVAQYLSDLALQVDQALDLYLPENAPYAEPIGEAMRYSVCGAGKRLRAALVVESVHVCGGAREKGLPLAAAIEMIHAYSLVHDDLPCMDDDDMRRGKPSNHKVYGEGIAVLAGDALLTEAFGLLARLPELAEVSADTTVRIIAEVAKAAGVGGMIGGQVADLMAEEKEPDRELLEYIHTHKTGALFTACTRTGALLGGADHESIRRLTEFAKHFGIAFQIVDDLLDILGDPELLGKEVGSDEKQGKLTFPRLYGVKRSEEMAEEHLRAAHRCLTPFGDRAERLHQLTDFVAARRV